MVTVENEILSVVEAAELSQRIDDLYCQMFSIRVVEQTLLDLYAEGRIAGTVHTSMGQEACDVGVINALDRSRDVIFSNHRAHGQFIAYCDDIEGLIAEIMGKSTGVCKGIGGSQHIQKRNMYTNGVQGGIVPNAVGAALAEKYKCSGAVTVVFLGDGTMGEGIVYESFNIAALWSLPVLFVVEDNGIAQSTPSRQEHAGSLATRADSFGICSASIQALDVLEVHSTAQEIIAWVRTQSAPFFLHVQTMRFGPHSKGDDTRPKAEIDALRSKDPLLKLANCLPDNTRLEIEESVRNRVQRAVELAVEADFPQLADLKAG